MTPLELAIKRLRTERGLTQQALADLVGVRQATISDIENGKSRLDTLDLIDALADALDVEVGDLFERVD